MRRLRILLLHAASDENRTFSYHHGWPRHFLADARYESTPLDLANRSWAARLRNASMAGLGRFEAIVLLHSVFSNVCSLTGWVFDAVRASSAPKAFFIGNEYKLMPEKMAFCEGLGIGLLVTQSHDERVHALYRQRLGCSVVGIPNTGLDPEIFFPRTPRAERPVELGYRSQPAPDYLGHNEREEIVAHFRELAARCGLVVDLSLKPEDRLDEGGYAEFLDKCKGQIGTEAGGDYFELTDATRLAVESYRRDHPGASFEDVRARFFRDRRDSVPIRILSGRNVEAAGTRTVQLLLDGEYGGYFKAGVHYIAIRKDYSNLDEAIRQFRDEGLCETLTQNAYAIATEQLTYQKLLDRFDAALRALL